MSERILIVDDDPAIRKLLEKVVRSNDLLPFTAESGKEAIQILKTETFDLILMDIMLGDMEGFDVIKEVRSRGVTTPIMVVSGRNEDYDALYGLSLGADDYITKPFRPVVLGAKIKALIRRNKSTASEQTAITTCGPFSYDSEKMRFYKDGEELLLSAKEGELMLLFMKHPDQVLTKDVIFERVWGDSIAVDDNTIMVYVNRLRAKIEEKKQKPIHILTVRGVGYRFIP